ncbi:MAG: membrane-bound lytic murein transglycosylase MltF, partial [Natronospirillum sp.]
MHILTRQRLIRRSAIWFSVSLVLAATFWLGFSRLSHLETIQRDGVLRAVILNDTRHYSHQGDTFEMALVREFAQHLQVSVHWQTVETPAELRRALRLGFADLAASGLTIPDQALTTRDMTFSRPYMEAQQQVVHKSTTVSQAEDLLDLTGGVRVDTPQQQALAALALELEIEPTVISTSGGADKLLQLLAAEEIHYAVIDSNDYAYYQPHYPRLRHGFDLTPPQPVGWMFSDEKDGSLQTAANKFLDQMDESGQLTVVLDRHFGHLREFDYVGIRRFERHVQDRLPRLRSDFEQAAQAVTLDWRLIAAVGYQESHWRPNAVSPTGVRGVMMLTLPTAGELGIGNRLDPSQSIDGGSRYLADLYSRMPEQVTDPDRIWFALAAYNVGMGHLLDARRIAETLEINPDVWSEMQKILPLLRDPDYYRFTRYGFARGDEPVVYVQNIRRYYDQLRWM